MYSKQIWAWALYDFANTAFSALFVTFFYPLFIKEYLGGNEFQIGMVFGGSMLFVALTVPFIGAFADLTGRRVQLVGLFTLLCVIATGFVGVSGLFTALVLGFIANYSYHSCLVVYNSVLPQLTKAQYRGSVSGFGVSIGYLGTIVSLGMVYALLSWLGWDTYAGIASIFPATALFFFGFSLFLFWYVGDRRKRKNQRLTRILRDTGKELWGTIKSLFTYQGLVPFLFSSYLYSNATTAAIIFLYLYAREEINMTIETFFWVYVLFAIAAAVGSYYSGKLSDKIGPKQTLVLSGIVWTAVILLLLYPQGVHTFAIAGCVGGAALGAIWTANRPMILQLGPSQKTGQFFGFNELADKFSGAIEPIIFGWLVVTYGYGAALWSLIAFFVAGLVLLYWVPSD